MCPGCCVQRQATLNQHPNQGDSLKPEHATEPRVGAQVAAVGFERGISNWTNSDMVAS